MAIQLGRHTFQGPYRDTANVANRPGVYLILCEQALETAYVDSGHGESLRRAIESDGNIDRWFEKCFGLISIAVLYTDCLPAEGRMLIEREVRALHGVGSQDDAR